MSKPLVILVGGFLGAGKTTLITTATAQLTASGQRVGLITNDQAANLVDTATLYRPGLAVQEVSGGCFCCRFDDLVEAMDRIVDDEAPDLLIGEPVGSCTDLSATVLQPLKQGLADRFRLAAFSVVVDATQLRGALDIGEPGRFPENVLYIYRKQLEEADVIVLNKVDLVGASEMAELESLLNTEFPRVPVIAVSAADGSGVAAWLDQVRNTANSGTTITDVDYDVYADGEAALGWVNAVVRLEGDQGTDWREFCRNFMEAVRSELQAAGAEIAHLKLHLTADHGTLTANLTSSRDELSICGQIDGSPVKARLLINARAHATPEVLRSIVEGCLEAAAGATIRIAGDDVRSFAPARPTPTHRFESVIEAP